MLGTRTRSTRVPNFSTRTRTRTQTTGNISTRTRTRTQHQSTQYSHEYRPSTSSEWVWFSLNSWDFEYYSLQFGCYHLMNCLIMWNSSLCGLIGACNDRKDYSEKKGNWRKNVAYPTKSDFGLHIFHCLISNQKTLICINSMFYKAKCWLFCVQCTIHI